MSRTYKVIIERNNGHYRAALASLPGVAVEAPTRNEALRQLRQAAADYLQQVELTTIELDLDVPVTPLRLGSPSAVLAAIAASKLDR